MKHRDAEAHLAGELFREYTKFAMRKRYVGPKRSLWKQEGFAWLSSAMNRWCFLPLKDQFNLDTVIVVNVRNLHNL